MSRNKTALFKKIIFIVLFFLIPLSFYRFLTSSFFSIKNIDIEKQNINCAQDLEIRRAGILGQNFLFLNSKEVAENLMNKFICIKMVVVEKDFPDKIKLKILGREAKLILIPIHKEASVSSILENIATPSAQDYVNIFLADEEGVIFSKGTLDVNLPKIFIYERVVNLGKDMADLITNVVKVLQEMRIFGVDVPTAKIISDEILVTDTKPLIIFKLNAKVEVQLASLQLILQQAKIDSNTLEFIDLRFDKPVVRIAPKKK